LSLSRFPLSVLLLFLARRPAWFVAVYIVTGLTDVFDGWLARKFHWDSELGAKIDGFADIAFMLCLLGVVFGVLGKTLIPQIEAYVIIGVCALALLKLVNLFYTRRKFRQWSTMHTLANKYTALPFYVLIPLFVVFVREIPGWLNLTLLALLGIVFLANLEETLILTLAKTYDTDYKSVFHLRKQQGVAVGIPEPEKEETRV